MLFDDVKKYLKHLSGFFSLSQIVKGILLQIINQRKSRKFSFHSFRARLLLVGQSAAILCSSFSFRKDYL